LPQVGYTAAALGLGWVGEGSELAGGKPDAAQDRARRKGFHIEFLQ
jgi:hypothetical protein